MPPHTERFPMRPSPFHTPSRWLGTLLCAILLSACSGGGSAPNPQTATLSLAASALETSEGASPIPLTADSGAPNDTLTWSLSANAPGKLDSHYAKATYTPPEPGTIGADTVVTVTVTAG